MKIWYLDLETGEMIENHDDAMKEFRNGHNIELTTHREQQGWIRVGGWEHDVKGLRERR